jgi:3-mercaptopyruvate sulfurtransferase SseA
MKVSSEMLLFNFDNDYLKSHIPNAVYLHFENLRIPEKGIPAQAPDRICLERLLGDNVGLSNPMWVVLYSEKSDPNATFLAWTLDSLGQSQDFDSNVAS